MVIRDITSTMEHPPLTSSLVEVCVPRIGAAWTILDRVDHPLTSSIFHPEALDTPPRNMTEVLLIMSRESAETAEQCLKRVQCSH